MEPLSRPRKILATKISYISQIMVYFGYIHEWAELYRQLWKDSREEWNSKSGAIFKVIMKNKDSRFKMLIKKPFTKKNAEFLLKNTIYNYFSLGILIDQERSYKAAINFLECLEEYPTFLFYDVKLTIRKETYDYANRFTKLYLDKGFDMEALKIKFINDLTHEMYSEFY